MARAVPSAVPGCWGPAGVGVVSAGEAAGWGAGREGAAGAIGEGLQKGGGEWM